MTGSKWNLKAFFQAKTQGKFCPTELPSCRTLIAPTSPRSTPSAPNSGSTDWKSPLRSAWDELYKNRSSRKTDSQQEKRSLGSPILLKIVSENRFSGKTHLYTIGSRMTRGTSWQRPSWTVLATTILSSKIQGRYSVQSRDFTTGVSWHVQTGVANHSRNWSINRLQNHGRVENSGGHMSQSCCCGLLSQKLIAIDCCPQSSTQIWSLS